MHPLPTKVKRDGKGDTVFIAYHPLITFQMDKKQKNSLSVNNSNSQTSATHSTSEPTTTFTQSEFSAFLDAMFAEGKKRFVEYLKTEEWRAIYE